MSIISSVKTQSKSKSVYVLIFLIVNMTHAHFQGFTKTLQQTRMLTRRRAVILVISNTMHTLSVVAICVVVGSAVVVASRVVVASGQGHREGGTGGTLYRGP